jgi:hypothetical protein
VFPYGLKFRVLGDGGGRVSKEEKGSEENEEDEGIVRLG